jgi:DNA gyrase subunit A
MIINRSGITIRLNVSDIRTIGRATQGVRLIKLNEGDQISSVAKVEMDTAEEIVDAVMEQSELKLDETLQPDVMVDPETTDEV